MAEKNLEYRSGGGSADLLGFPSIDAGPELSGPPISVVAGLERQDRSGESPLHGRRAFLSDWGHTGAMIILETCRTSGMSGRTGFGEGEILSDGDDPAGHARGRTNASPSEGAAPPLIAAAEVPRSLPRLSAATDYRTRGLH